MADFIFDRDSRVYGYTSDIDVNFNHLSGTQTVEDNGIIKEYYIEGILIPGSTYCSSGALWFGNTGEMRYITKNELRSQRVHTL